MTKPVLAITMGDPAGVGPEICLKVLGNKDLARVAVPVVLGSRTVMENTAKALNIPLDAKQLEEGQEKIQTLQDPALINVAPEWGEGVVPGQISSEAGRAAYRYIEYAIRGTLDKTFSALVTSPIHKRSLREGGIQFPGHTEIIAALTHTPESFLMLWSPRIVVAMVTLHTPLDEVGPLIQKDRVEKVIRLTHAALEKMLGHPPRICVLGFNPHSGDQGLFGSQDDKEIRPAIDSAKAQGMDVTGPFSPDAAFTPAALKRFDAFVAMYHDQGHIPFKMLSFDDGVNWTLGVPIVRTSVDHGTAFDIVGKGVASPNSLLAAARLAVKLVTSAKKT